MYGAILPSLETLRAIAKTAHFDKTSVGLGWLVFGADCAKHVVEEEEFLRYYDAERKLMRR